MLITMSYSEWEEQLRPCTNRQLLKEYRELKKLTHAIYPHAQHKDNLYLGENATIQLHDARRGLEIAKRYLEQRGYVIARLDAAMDKKLAQS